MKCGPRKQGGRDPIVRLIIASLPELQHFLTDEDRYRAIRAIEEQSYEPVSQKEENARLLLFCSLIAVFLSLGQLVGRSTQWPTLASTCVSFLLLISAGLLLRRLLEKRKWTKALREQLILANVPICVPCGYLLKGLPESTKSCPECGKVIGDDVRNILRKTNEPVSTQV